VTYRPHRSHVRYAPITAVANPPRRRAMRSPVLANGTFANAGAVSGANPSGAMTGLLYGLPRAVLLWAALVALARAMF
jgi:hypothetical protein